MGNHAKVTIYYNPRCRKSREALEIIKEKGYDPEIRNYLEDPPTKSELAEILRKMGKKPRDIFRKSEPLYKDLGLKNKDLSDDALLDYLVQYPILIERPIVVRGQRAVLGRPPEDVKKIL
ncbi:MAG: arsenate reductase (glutaredoxin) [Leptospiraceae bacterium]|nr:arsenate reductase (glutaredoxin) [Leptospiraceae bacterium]MDW8306372.1 arsenate reductase (glutaredoxin) [Leptospiraceae bacterium]